MKYPYTPLLVGLLLASGCSSYRAEPLSPPNELRHLQQRTPMQSERQGELKPSAVLTSASHSYNPDDGLNEAEMVMIALSFNPDLRERRHAIAKIGQADLLGMVRFKPEMRVNVDSATVGIAADSEMLYTLLIPRLRQAWHDDEAARRAQSQAEMLADEALIVSSVRRAHMTVLAEEQRLRLAEQRHQQRADIAREYAENTQATPLDRSVATIAWQHAALQLRTQKRQVADARRELNRLLGFDPSLPLKLSDSDKPLVRERVIPLSLSELDEQLLSGRWELKIEEALYKRAEFNYSQAVVGQYPKLRLAPAVTYDREEGTSFKLGASLRIPWPEDAATKAEDAAQERARARASYVAKLHELRALAHRAHAHVQQAIDNLAELEPQREALRTHRASAETQRQQGHLSVSDYLPLIERCETLEWEWITAGLDYRLASIDLDHATGRLNRYAAEAQDRPTELKPQ
jgi:outer membrane protein TolC